MANYALPEVLVSTDWVAENTPPAFGSWKLMSIRRPAGKGAFEELMGGSGSSKLFVKKRGERPASTCWRGGFGLVRSRSLFPPLRSCR